MTDPVNTDALRGLANDVGLGWDLGPDLIAAVDEVDRLRAVIENAPHGSNCENGLYVPWTCTCWKADAL